MVAGVAALVAVTAARIALVNALPDQGYFAKYLIFADRILAGHIPRDRLADLSPGYLWLVVAVRALGLQFTAIRALQIAFVSAAALFTAIAARRFGVVAMIAAPLLVLGSRAALVCATEMEPETVILMLNAAAIAVLSVAQTFLSARSGETQTGMSVPQRPEVLAGILLGLSAICRPSAVLAVFALAIVLRSWRLIAAAAVPVIAIVVVNLALTGEAVLMDPGTVFYEGMNPNAGGYEGVQPRIVNDIERTTSEPDYLHVAYRIVASRSMGRPLTRAQSNRFWTGKALVFMSAYPLAALRLTGNKMLFAVQSYDAYDLATMARKDFLLARWPFVPFGLVVALAGVAVLLRRRDVLPLVVFALCCGVVLVVFYVTARQRNAMLPAMAVLAAIGFAEIVSRRHWGAAVAAAIVAILLSAPGPPQREDRRGWFGPPNDFDAAITLEQQGRWAEADRLLAGLNDYRPMRENRAVSSVAFYRARAALHLGRDPHPFLDRAEREAPGNEQMLALRATLGDTRARALLFDLHDALTARRSLSLF